MVGIFIPFHGFELLVDLRALNEGVKDVENGVAAPCIWIFAEELSIFGGGISAGDTVTIAAEGLELVDELVYYVPGPVVLSKPLSIIYIVNRNRRGVTADGRHFQFHRAFRVEYVVEEVTVTIVTSKLRV